MNNAFQNRKTRNKKRLTIIAHVFSNINTYFTGYKKRNLNIREDLAGAENTKAVLR
jgi:hypothetical protein